MPIEITAREFYDRLIAGEIIDSTGNITFSLNNTTIQIETKDSIGNMIQEWVKSWANDNNIYLRANENSQEFPDFYLSQSNIDNLLEIKSFDYTKNPNFDLANFDTYTRALMQTPQKLDADYIVFGYSLVGNQLIINNVWIKKIWEITTSSGNWDLRVQVKQDIIYNIRPASFNSNNARFLPFNNKILFLEAIQGVLNQYVNANTSHNNWLNDFRNAYQTATGNELI